MAKVMGGRAIPLDETVILDRGKRAHITYLPRKPSPLGVMFKTTCSGESRVMLNLRTSGRSGGGLEEGILFGVGRQPRLALSLCKPMVWVLEGL